MRAWNYLFFRFNDHVSIPTYIWYVMVFVPLIKTILENDKTSGSTISVVMVILLAIVSGRTGPGMWKVFLSKNNVFLIRSAINNNNDILLKTYLEPFPQLICRRKSMDQSHRCINDIIPDEGLGKTLVNMIMYL